MGVPVPQFSAIDGPVGPPLRSNGRAMTMGQDLNKVESMYDALAKEYAEKFCGEHEKKPQDREILYRFSQVVAGKKPIWDLGCGPGQTTQYLRNLGVEIFGLDVSEKLLEQAKVIHPGIIFRKGNILDLKFENESIAGIVAFYALVHFSQEQVANAFREIFRVLKPVGVFLFTYHIGEGAIHLDEFLGKDVDIDFMFFKTDFISLCVKDAGFEDIEILERDPYPEVEYQSRRAYVFAKKPTRNSEPQQSVPAGYKKSAR
jgi:SAM-dependent methyltransferase